MQRLSQNLRLVIVVPKSEIIIIYVWTNGKP